MKSRRFMCAPLGRDHTTTWELCCALQQTWVPIGSFGSFSSDQPAPDALGMSASLRSRPNLRTAAIRRSVPIPDSCTAAKTAIIRIGPTLSKWITQVAPASGDPVMLSRKVCEMANIAMIAFQEVSPRLEPRAIASVCRMRRRQLGDEIRDVAQIVVAESFCRFVHDVEDALLFAKKIELDQRVLGLLRAQGWHFWRFRLSLLAAAGETGREPGDEILGHGRSRGRCNHCKSYNGGTHGNRAGKFGSLPPSRLP